MKQTLKIPAGEAMAYMFAADPGLRPSGVYLQVSYMRNGRQAKHRSQRLSAFHDGLRGTCRDMFPPDEAVVTRARVRDLKGNAFELDLPAGTTFAVLMAELCEKLEFRRPKALFATEISWYGGNDGTLPTELPIPKGLADHDAIFDYVQETGGRILAGYRLVARRINES